MNLIIEALFVGFYTFFISYVIINPFKSVYFYLFIIGFLKHYISYYLQIQDYYCYYNNKKKTDNSYLFKDSLMEGIIFIFIGNIIVKLSNLNIHISLFITGFLFHIIAEYIGLHDFFILRRCIL